MRKIVFFSLPLAGKRQIHPPCKTGGSERSKKAVSSPPDEIYDGDCFRTVVTGGSPVDAAKIDRRATYL
jgi:hypothetical protein